MKYFLGGLLCVGFCTGVSLRVDVIEKGALFPSAEDGLIDKGAADADELARINEAKIQNAEITVAAKSADESVKVAILALAPIANASDYMAKWPTCNKLNTTHGGPAKLAEIAQKSCREMHKDDISGTSNCFRGACFLAAGGGLKPRSEEEEELARQNGSMNGSVTLPKPKVVTPFGKLSPHDYRILSQALPGHRVSHFCQLDGHTPSQGECADDQCVADMHDAWHEWFHNNGKHLLPDRMINFAIFKPEKVYPNLEKACKFCCTMKFLKNWTVTSPVCGAA